jgi:HEAT repeat protein
MEARTTRLLPWIVLALPLGLAGGGAVALPPDKPPADRLAPLLKALAGGDREARVGALEQMGDMGESALDAVPAILNAVEVDPDLAHCAGRALNKMGPKALSLVTCPLTDVHPARRLAAARVLKGMGVADAIPDLAPVALRDKDEEVRKEALGALGRTHDKRAVAPLTEAALASRGDLRRASLGGLYCLADVDCPLGDAAIAALACIVVEEKDSQLRLLAAEVLVKLDSAEALAALAAIVRDPKAPSDARRVGVHGLNLMAKQRPGAVQLLSAALRDPDVDVRLLALSALERIGPAAKKAVGAVETLLSDAAAEVRVRAAETLLELDPTNKRAVPVLLKESQHTAADIRCTAIGALGRTDGKEVVAALLRGLRDEAEAVRGRSVSVLHYRRQPPVPEAIAALREVAEADASPEIRREAKEAVADLERMKGKK